MTKKICFLISNLNHSGGTERVTSMIANELTTFPENKIFILSLSNGLNSFFNLSEKIQLDNLYPNKISMKKNLLGAIWRLRKYVVKNQIDTIVIVDSILCVFSVPALWGLRVNHICWEHFNFNVDLGVAFRRLGRKWAARYCDYIVTLTAKDKILWENGLKYIKANIIPIYNPTPYENVDHSPCFSNKIILSAGRLTYQKGFDLLLDAWAQTKNLDNQWKLQILGTGEDEMSLKAQANKLGITSSVEFIPATKNISSYYSQASFFCLSSRFEGFGMVILEAQSFGLPVVAFDCEVGPSDLITNKVNGLLVESENTVQLAHALEKSMQFNEEQYKQMVKASRQNSQRFTLEQVVSQWKQIL